MSFQFASQSTITIEATASPEFTPNLPNTTRTVCDSQSVLNKAGDKEWTTPGVAANILGFCVPGATRCRTISGNGRHRVHERRVSRPRALFHQHGPAGVRVAEPAGGRQGRALLALLPDREEPAARAAGGVHQRA